MSNTVPILRVTSFLGFIFANIISFVFFNHFISEIPIYVYLVSVLIAFIIFKTDIAIWIYYSLKERLTDKNKNLEEDVAQNEKSDSINVKLIRVKYGIVLIRLTFFNTLYELFPVYFIWLSVFGFFFWIDVLKIPPSSLFYQLVAIFGLLLGIFQFSLERYEQKIAIKLTSNTKLITNILDEETSYNKFYQSLDENKDKILINWINKNVDPKLQAIDYLKSIARDEDALKILKTIMRKTRTSSLITVNSPPQDSNRKFEIIEMMCENDKNRKKDLIKAYNSFFNNKETVNLIMNKIENEVDIKEFGITAISNINIVPEIIPQFASFKFQNFFDGMLNNSMEATENDDVLIPANELRNNLHAQILKLLMRKIIN